ncbi:hypothetical protein D9M72_612500 [compost metagenome]
MQSECTLLGNHAGILEWAVDCDGVDRLEWAAVPVDRLVAEVLIVGRTANPR